MVVWGNLTTFARTLKEGERVYVSDELRYRGCDKEVSKERHR